MLPRRPRLDNALAYVGSYGREVKGQAIWKGAEKEGDILSRTWLGPIRWSTIRPSSCSSRPRSTAVGCEFGTCSRAAAMAGLIRIRRVIVLTGRSSAARGFITIPCSCPITLSGLLVSARVSRLERPPGPEVLRYNTLSLYRSACWRIGPSWSRRQFYGPWVSEHVEGALLTQGMFGPHPRRAR